MKYVYCSTNSTHQHRCKKELYVTFRIRQNVSIPELSPHPTGGGYNAPPLPRPHLPRRQRWTVDTMGGRRRNANQNSFLTYYFNNFSASWHVAAIYPCHHVGPPFCGAHVLQNIWNMSKSTSAVDTIGKQSYVSPHSHGSTKAKVYNAITAHNHGREPKLDRPILFLHLGISTLTAVLLLMVCCQAILRVITAYTAHCHLIRR